MPEVKGRGAASTFHSRPKARPGIVGATCRARLAAARVVARVSRVELSLAS